MGKYDLLDEIETPIPGESAISALTDDKYNKKRLALEMLLVKMALKANEPVLAWVHELYAFNCAQILSERAFDKGHEDEGNFYQETASLLDEISEITISKEYDLSPYAETAFSTLLENYASGSAPSGTETGTGSGDEKCRVERPKVRMDDVAGIDEVKKQIRLRLIEPVQNPEEAKKHGLKTGGGILLYGPPGTGKTFIAKAVAGELDLPFFSITAADIFGKYVGESENNIRDFFNTARKYPLSVVFIDELESIFQKRSESVHETTQKVISVILQELDGVRDNRNPMLLLGATNAPWLIDEAFMRTGRFDVKIYVGLPDVNARQKIIRNAFRDVKYPVDSDAVDYMAENTDRFSGADLTGIAQIIKQTAFDRKLTRYSLPLFQECLSNAVPSGNAEISAKIEEWEKSNEISRPEKGREFRADQNKEIPIKKVKELKEMSNGNDKNRNEDVNAALREAAALIGSLPEVRYKDVLAKFAKWITDYQKAGDKSRAGQCFYLLNCLKYILAASEIHRHAASDFEYNLLIETAEAGLPEAKTLLETLGCTKQAGRWSAPKIGPKELEDLNCPDIDCPLPGFGFIRDGQTFTVPSLKSLDALVDKFCRNVTAYNDFSEWCCKVEECQLDCDTCVLCSNLGDAKTKIENFLWLIAQFGFEPDEEFEGDADIDYMPHAFAMRSIAEMYQREGKLELTSVYFRKAANAFALAGDSANERKYIEKAKEIEQQL